MPYSELSPDFVSAGSYTCTCMTGNAVRILSFFLFVAALGGLPAAEPEAPPSFSYRHQAEDQWRLTSEITEEILYDGEPYAEAEILNKIAVRVLDGDGGAGRLWNRYQIAERPLGGDVYTWSVEYETEYRRDRRGRLSGLPANSPVPAVRDVPVYPEDPPSPGDRWSHPGREVFDLEPTFGIPALIAVDFVAEYTFLGMERDEDRNLARVLIEYGYTWNPGVDALEAFRDSLGAFPVELNGDFRQELLWDPAAGRNFAENGRFSYTWRLSDGHSYTFRGRSKGRAVYAPPMDREALVDEIAGLGDGNLRAEAVDDGVSVTLENIHFVPDRAVMLPGEEDTLERISGILRRYPDRDILVVGHTARIDGRSDGRILSRRRAETVARYFIENGVRNATQVMTRGMGHTQPIGDNATEEGRRRNRRVEIIILEN